MLLVFTSTSRENYKHFLLSYCWEVSDSFCVWILHTFDIWRHSSKGKILHCTWRHFQRLKNAGVSRQKESIIGLAQQCRPFFNRYKSPKQKCWNRGVCFKLPRWFYFQFSILLASVTTGFAEVDVGCQMPTCSLFTSPQKCQTMPTHTKIQWLAALRTFHPPKKNFLFI